MEDLQNTKTLVPCVRCGSSNVILNGHSRIGFRRYRCKDCRKEYDLNPNSKFWGLMSPYLNGEIFDKNEQQNIMQKEKHLVGGISGEELCSMYDVRHKIEQFLQSIPLKTFFVESDVIINAGLKGMAYRGILDGNDFKDYKGKAGGKVYWGHPESIKEMKEKAVLT